MGEGGGVLGTKGEWDGEEAGKLAGGGWRGLGTEGKWDGEEAGKLVGGRKSVNFRKSLGSKYF